jgi:Curli production assembly/transport component CsgG
MKYILSILFIASSLYAADVVAIVDFPSVTGSLTAFSSFVADEQSIAYSARPEVTLVERGQLKKVLKEQGIQASGAFDEATATKLGKLLGANRIVTGQYYPMGDEFQVVAKTIETATGKVIKVEKLKYARSESTAKLDAMVLGPEVAPAVSAQTTPAKPAAAVSATSQGSNGPLVIEGCRRGECYGMVTSPEGETFGILGGSRFAFDNGERGDLVRYEIGGRQGEQDLLPSIKTKVCLVFCCGGKSFSYFQLKYKLGKESYEWKGIPPALKD